MKRILAALSVACALAAVPAHATLAVGSIAPDFSTVASLGGRDFDFSLNEALKRGPVVLYFYPAAFTKGCTIEAHEFADATDKFKAMGATVIGVSHDNIATLDKFSVSECRSKFAVAADPDGNVIRAYDTPLPQNPAIANRTSYVIAPDHRIIMVYTAMDPYQHVDLTLRAVSDWEATHHRR